MSEPRPETVQQFWQYMTQHYGASVIDKRNAVEMRVAGEALSRLGIVNRKDFLEHFTTTLGHRIYVPFTPGVESEIWSLWEQIKVCVHECTHVEQYDRLGALSFSWKYLRSAGRTQLEAEAYRSTMEMEYWRSGRIIPPATLSESLRNYGVTADDVKVFERMLEMTAESIKRGAIINPATRKAIDWLRVHAPELREGWT
jgi:hypothetical protein